MESHHAMNDTPTPISKTAPGTVFGRLTVIRDAEPGDKAYGVVCQCSCNSPEVTVGRYLLTRGQTKSCGCLRRERAQMRIA